MAVEFLLLLGAIEKSADDELVGARERDVCGNAENSNQIFNEKSSSRSGVKN